MGGIFLNYRHSDQRVLIVAAMRNALAHHFGDDQVFMDRQMSSGTRYPTAIRDGLEHADVLVAVIHEGWLEECKGPGDWVYEEIRSAITQGKYLVQLVLPGAARLKVKELEQRFPEIRELAVRQALSYVTLTRIWPPSRSTSRRASHLRGCRQWYHVAATSHGSSHGLQELWPPYR